jgi:hypothetical protein
MPRNGTSRNTVKPAVRRLPVTAKPQPDNAESGLTNSEIAELLATEAESASQPLQKAFRRASRKALLWPEEAHQLHRDGRSLTELPGIGPYLETIVDRQDLSLDLIRMAQKAGCRISIGTDSHGPSQLRFIEFGLAAAKLGGIDPSRILNFMSGEKLLGWAESVREKNAIRITK